MCGLSGHTYSELDLFLKLVVIGMTCVLGQVATCHPLLSGVIFVLQTIGGEQSAHRQGCRQRQCVLTILVAWEIWKERNARIFDRHHNTMEALIGKIKEEARLWCAAGAKKLYEIIPTSIA
jgi:hypothetical protein